MLESIDFPTPVIQLAVEPKTKADQEKLGMAIQKLAQEDPTFHVATDPETGTDHSLRHGRAASGNHRRPHDARIRRGGQCRQAAGGVSRNRSAAKPKPTRSSPSRPAAAASTAHVKIRMEPLPPGSGFEFENDIFGGSIPEGIHQADRSRHERSARRRHSGGLSDVGSEGHPLRRQLPRRRLVGNGVQDRRLDGVQGSGEAGQAGAARADHERRSGGSRKSTWAT